MHFYSFYIGLAYDIRKAFDMALALDVGFALSGEKMCRARHAWNTWVRVKQIIEWCVSCITL